MNRCYQNRLVESAVWILSCFYALAFVLTASARADDTDKFVKMLNSKYSPLRQIAAVRLGDIKDPRTVEPLIAALKDKNRDVREAAAFSLGKIKDVRAAEPLLAVIKDPDPLLAWDAANSFVELGEIKDPHAIEPLISALTYDYTGDVISQCISCKGYYCRGIPVCQCPTRTQPELIIPVRQKAAESLVNIGTLAVPPLLVVIKDSDAKVRANAAWALGQIKDPGAIVPLIAVLKDTDAIVNKYAREALASIGTPAVQQLIVALKDTDATVRTSAAIVLGSIAEKDPSAVAPQIASLADYNVQLVAAATRGDLNAVLALLDKGADVNAMTGTREGTALMAASGQGHLEVVRLLASRADVGAKDGRGRTALYIAAEFGYRDVAELLIANKANVNAATNDGLTPLQIAAFAGHKEVAELLLANGADVNANAHRGQTALYSAASNGHRDVAELLIANKADVNVVTNFGYTPLHAAAEFGHRDVAELLNAKGANVNIVTKFGYTPLHAAAEFGYKDVAELLIAKGADVSAKDSIGRTAVYFAAANGHKDVTELLIANKADVNVVTSDGFTPLHAAAQFGYRDVAELLIAKGADLNAKARAGGTSLYFAEEFGQEDVAELLREHGGELSPKLPKQFLSADRIVILPIVDTRADKTEKVNLQSVGNFAQQILRKRHCAAIQSDKALAGNWALTITLTGLSGGVPVALVSGSLSGKANQEPWAGSASGRYRGSVEAPGVTPLVAASRMMTDLMMLTAMRGSAREEALSNAVANLLNQIPDATLGTGGKKRSRGDDPIE